MNRISVLLAEDHTIVREGFRALLEKEGSTEVVAEACNGREAVELARKFRPSVVVMDIAMPDLNGFEAARQIMQTVPETKLLMLSAYDDDAYVDQVIALGASGYLLKQSSGKMLAIAIQEVKKGNKFFSPSIARRLRKRTNQSPSHSGTLKTKNTKLSRRESETLQLIVEGKANKQIAAELGIGIKTVEKHRHNLMAKLDIHDTAGLTRYAIAAGIIEVAVQLKVEHVPSKPKSK